MTPASFTSVVRYILTFALFAQLLNTNPAIFRELAWAESYNREVDLIHSLLNQTNRNFDQKVYSSFTTNTNGPVVISYHLVSFTFYYPAGIAIPPSSTEMANPDELVCRRTTSSGEPRQMRFRPTMFACLIAGERMLSQNSTCYLALHHWNDLKT
jgi:hypothetical protein